MLLGLNGATTMRADLATDIRVAGQAGYDVVELWAAKLDRFLQKHTVDDLLRLLLAARVAPYSINSVEQITFREPAEYRDQVASRCRYLAEVAARLKCPYIVVVPSDKPAGVTWDEILEESVRVLRDLANIASEYEVGLAFEFIGQAGRSVATLDKCWEVVRATNRQNVGLVLDTFHFYAGGSSLAAIRQLDPRKLFVLHLNDADEAPSRLTSRNGGRDGASEDRPKCELTDAHRLFPGLGVIPLRQIIAALRAIGYDGVASIEIFRPEYWAWDPLRVALEAKKHAEAVLKVTG
jgi:2-keto-myo-inositol isomerase